MNDQSLLKVLRLSTYIGLDILIADYFIQTCTGTGFPYYKTNRAIHIFTFRHQIGRSKEGVRDRTNASLAGDAAGDVARVRPELRDDLGEGERVQPDDQRAHPLDRLSHAHVPLLQVR